jgi:hypothetical protein
MGLGLIAFTSTHTHCAISAQNDYLMQYNERHNIHGDVKENVHWVDDINADIEEGQITEPYLSRMAKKRRIETSEQARARARDRDYALEEGELLEY